MTKNNRPLSCRTVYLLRHGDCRQDGIKRYLGQSDLPLNTSGQAQALNWQRELAETPLQRIFCSDLSRSFETASIIAEKQNCQVQPLARLREINLGSWDGLSMAEVRRRHPAEFHQRGAELVSYRTPGGECFADVAARVVPLFEEIIHAVSGQVLIVAHAGVNMVLLSHVLGLPLANLQRLQQDYGGLNIIDCGSWGVRLRGVNLCSLPKRRQKPPTCHDGPPEEQTLRSSPWQGTE